jgi:hypothetical protein
MNSWASTSRHKEALVLSPPTGIKYWGMVSLAGCIQSPRMAANGLATGFHVAQGYQGFMLCKTPTSYSLKALAGHEGIIEECLEDVTWDVVIVPPGGTL